MNQRADFLNKLVDYDDWKVSKVYFKLMDKAWGPQTDDRLANH